MDMQLLEEDRRQARERRRAERVKSLLKARIYFNQRMTSFDCVVKNISPLGAKVALDKSIAIPEDFELEIPMRGKFYKAKLRWRDAEGIGMEFIDDGAAQEDQHSAEKLKAENIRLKQAIMLLTKKLEDLGQDVPKFF